MLKEAGRLIESYKMDINKNNKVKGQLVRDASNYHFRQFKDGAETLPFIVEIFEGLPILMASFVEKLVNEKRLFEAKSIVEELNMHARITNPNIKQKLN